MNAGTSDIKFAVLFAAGLIVGVAIYLGLRIALYVLSEIVWTWWWRNTCQVATGETKRCARWATATSRDDETGKIYPVCDRHKDQP